jgi:hypothetical protein
MVRCTRTMIITNLILLVFRLFNSVLAIFPNAPAGLYDHVQSAIYNIKLIMAGWNWILPVTDIFLAVNILLGSVIAICVFLLVRWVVSIVSLNLIH